MAQEVRQAFFADRLLCQELTKELYNQRGIVIKLKEGLARLVSPLL